MKQIEQRTGRRKFSAFERGHYVFKGLADVFDVGLVDGPGRPLHTVDLAEDRFHHLRAKFGAQVFLQFEEPGRYGRDMLSRLDLECRQEPFYECAVLFHKQQIASPCLAHEGGFQCLRKETVG